MTNEVKVNKNVLLVSFPFLIALAIIGDPFLIPVEPIASLGEFIALYVLMFLVLPAYAWWLKHLWNAVVPAVFGIKYISFLEAFGLMCY